MLTAEPSIDDAAGSNAATHSGAVDPITRRGHIAGTLEYMSPEQVEGKEADPRSDIFAMGAVLYEMATGGSPQMVSLSGTGIATTTTTLSSSLNPSMFGQSVTFTAVVSSASGTPTGTVTFADGNTTVGTATLANGLPLNSAHSDIVPSSHEQEFEHSGTAIRSLPINSPAPARDWHPTVNGRRRSRQRDGSTLE